MIYNIIDIPEKLQKKVVIESTNLLPSAVVQILHQLYMISHLQLKC